MLIIKFIFRLISYTNNIKIRAESDVLNIDHEIKNKNWNER